VETPNLHCTNLACGHTLFGIVPFCPYCGELQRHADGQSDIDAVPPASQTRRPPSAAPGETTADSSIEIVERDPTRAPNQVADSKPAVDPTRLETAEPGQTGLATAQITQAELIQRTLELEKKAKVLSATASSWRNASALRRASWLFWTPRFGPALLSFWLIIGLVLASAVRQNLQTEPAQLPWLAWLKIGMAALVLATILAKIPELLRLALRRDLVRVMPELAPLFEPPVLTNGYIVSMRGEQHGPFTSGELQQMILRDQINLTTLIWRQGMNDWRPAGLVPGATDLGPLSRSRLRRLAATVAGEPKPPAFAAYASALRKINTQIAALGVLDPAQFIVKRAALPGASAIAAACMVLLVFLVFGGPLYGDYFVGREQAPAPTLSLVPATTVPQPRVGQPAERESTPPALQTQQADSQPRTSQEPAPAPVAETATPPKRPEHQQRPPFTQGMLIGPEPLHEAPDPESTTVTAPGIMPMAIVGRQIGADRTSWLVVQDTHGHKLFVESTRVKPWDEWRAENAIRDWFRGFANDTTHVYVGNTAVVELYGVTQAPGQRSNRMISSYLMKQKAQLVCTPQTTTLYVCITDQKLDLADFVLLNGSALATPDTLPDYRRTEAEARRRHNGYWREPTAAHSPEPGPPPDIPSVKATR
jgi:hypothetical protein